MVVYISSLPKSLTNSLHKFHFTPKYKRSKRKLLTLYSGLSIRSKASCFFPSTKSKIAKKDKSSLTAFPFPLFHHLIQLSGGAMFWNQILTPSPTTKSKFCNRSFHLWQQYDQNIASLSSDFILDMSFMRKSRRNLHTSHLSACTSLHTREWLGYQAGLTQRFHSFSPDQCA